MPAPTTYEIGSTLVGIAELGSLTTPGPAPESTFNDYPDTARLQSGLTRGLGLPTAEWRYGYLTEAQFDQLKTFCSGLSANVYIATLNNSNTYARYSAVMVMPTSYRMRNDNYLDFTITFNNLVVQP